MRSILSILLLLSTFIKIVKCAQELQFLQIIFSHKTYAPILNLINSNDTYLPSQLTYEHFNAATLRMPKTGMLDMYNLGVHFREIYDDFLGEIYMQTTMKMRTSGYPLSMISGQLVNAGLWPPTGKQKWSTDLNWQPIPTDYAIETEDNLLLGIHCPSFVLEMEKVLAKDETKLELSRHSTLFNRVSRYAEIAVRHPSEMALLYDVLETQADLNRTLPYWAQDIFPYGGMYNVSLLEYDLLWQTDLQKQLIGGTILKEVLANALMFIRGDIPRSQKLNIYSGNERNIVGILKGLDLWSPHIPNAAASVIFELYFDNETESHGIKVNYYTGVDGVTIPLTIPNCTEICPIKKFLYSIFDLIPRNADRLCKWKKIDLSENNVTINESINNGSFKYKIKNIIFYLFIAISLCMS